LTLQLAVDEAFVGDLAEALVRRGDEVIGLDNLTTGRRRNLDALATQGAFNLIEGTSLYPQTSLARSTRCFTSPRPPRPRTTMPSRWKRWTSAQREHAPCSS
jgi:hypothetical protein